MTDKQLKAIYQTACEGKNYTPNEGQYKIWKQILGWAEESDLAQALIYYFSENVSFPMPAELKPLAERARLARVAKSSERKYLVRLRCPDCRATMSGFLTAQDYAVRICNSPYTRSDAENRRTGAPCGSRCGAEMVIDHDERRFAA